MGLTYLSHLVSASHFRYEIQPEESILSVNRKKGSGGEDPLFLAAGGGWWWLRDIHSIPESFDHRRDWSLWSKSSPEKKYCYSWRERKREEEREFIRFHILQIHMIFICQGSCFFFFRAAP